MKTPSKAAALLLTLVLTGRAQETKPEAPAPPVAELILDVMSVVGRGETRATSTLTKVELQSAVAGLEPMLALRSLPGVVVQTNDSLGLYEFGASVRIRAFDLTQISFDVDGVPMGRNDERGNRVSRFVESDMTQSISLSQGSGDVSTPAYNALGGAVHYTTDGPASTRGAQFNYTAGSGRLQRGFARVDLGEIGAGITGFVSYSNTYADVSFGPGTILRRHVEAKLQKYVGAFKVVASYRYNDRYDHDVFSIDVPSWRAGNYAVLFAGFTGDPGVDTLNYERWINGRRDHLFNFNITGQVTPELKLTFVPYLQNQRGYGTAWEDHGDDLIIADLPATGRNAIAGPYRLTAREEVQKSNRVGLTGRAEYVHDLAGLPNTLALGFWLEGERYSRLRVDYELSGAGSAVAGQYGGAMGLPPPILDKTKPVYTIYDHHFDNKVFQFYVEDRLKAVEGRLGLTLAVKSLDVNRHFTGIPTKRAYVLGEYDDRARTFKNTFSPQVGASFDLTKTEQLFVNFAKNSSVPGFNYFTNYNYDSSVSPESSTNWDLGVRTSRGALDASFTGYFVDYKNRLLDVTPATSRYLVLDPVLQNVGQVKTKGLEAAIVWKPLHGLRLNASLSYTDSKFQDNYSDGGVIVPVKGKRTPQVPVFSLQTSVDYDHGSGFSVGVGAQSMTKRYGTFLNDESVPGYTVFAAHAGYACKRGFGCLKKPFIRVNADNLLDKKYLGQIDGVTVSGPNYYYQGMPRSIYVAVGGSF
jgi:iron complex outermembrane receptor protein